MAGPVQVIPPGLLSFFQLKTMGRNPSDLVESIQPNLDMRDWYFASKREQSTLDVAGATLALGFNNNATVDADGGFNVPADQWWFIEHMRFAVQTNAADDIRFSLAFRPSLGTSGTYLMRDQQPWVPTAAIALASFPCATGGGFFAAPGTLLRYWIHSANPVNPARTINLALEFVRLRI